MGTKYMIEDRTTQKWLTNKGFTNNPREAMRFDRKQDAYDYLDNDLNGYKSKSIQKLYGFKFEDLCVTEHIFMNPISTMENMQ